MSLASTRQQECREREIGRDVEREREKKREKEFRLWTEKEILESETELETGRVDKDFKGGGCGI